ncbi:2-oxo-4-hydroxy-4-carboxy-5-ureidoimidazoline decarboxylase [Hahella sp. HN01]|uniref:2-oxo-4-hydroxy-4-carboxy-5-ureidoimidazoline decarboxylase n=1 Tax=Hahella sp. HN01 TaxID=2847262 RepID=UPI001C1F163F|nr:2-oxo-4-hydroxy-4-carboxy-5-ureidoimidazoline decarboxylase [Hahella sp. HN01]MBU6953141.1 2-oxo-4-hydroxy-4-carboxy-5-ureidoimidazoline decarboxylase [Hahella sp. HN01]
MSQVTLEQLNAMPEQAAQATFQTCCSSEAWARGMTAARPFADSTSVHETADRIWAGLTEQDYLEAFAGHPKIGDVNSLRAKYAHTKALAAGEQSGVNSADEDTLQRLATGNQAYEEKFGFIFIVCATGKSAAEMLSLLEARLPNARSEEVINAAEEQRKITRIRLEKLL